MMPPLLRYAVWLGAAPLLIGTAIYIVWRFTHWPWLETAGLLTILFGVLAFLFGVAALLLHWQREWQSRRTPPGSLILQTVLTGSLLFSNFPVAGHYVSSAIEFHTRYTVLIQNDSHGPIERFAISGPGVQIELGPIAPGQRIDRRLHFHGEGALRFHGSQRGIEFDGEIDGYVSDGIGGGQMVRIQSPAAHEILPIKLRPTVWEG